LKNFNGVPSHDTFGRVFGKLELSKLAKALSDFLEARVDAISKNISKQIKKMKFRHICIDGKCERGTGREASDLPDTHVLNVFNATTGVCLDSRPIDKKTNEIPVAREILKEMSLYGCLVTMDALHAQTDTLEINPFLHSVAIRI
jgi:hypothetical protein